MSWAAKRETTSPEDIAYSLLGIFGITMPVLYGEGVLSAMLRLQEEIMRRTHDLTIFAWGFGLGPIRSEVFARSPADFGGCGVLTKSPEGARGRRAPYSVTNVGVQTTIPFADIDKRVCYILFDTVSCRDDILAIPMTWNDDQDDMIERSAGSVPVFVPPAWLERAHRKQGYIVPCEREQLSNSSNQCVIRLSVGMRSHHYRIAEVYPPDAVIFCLDDTHEVVSPVMIRYTNGTSSFLASINIRDGNGS